MNLPRVLPTPGLIVDKYELLEELGRGGMGSVWKARHTSLDTRFAIKFIEAEYNDSKEARDRFDREARAAAKIQSRHAIQIVDHGVTIDGKPYIVMELLEGEGLDRRIERGPITLQETARILQQVCRGLARAHEQGVVHRDLKPENIFLSRSPDDDEEVAKVLDFGIAKDMHKNPAMTSGTKTGAVLGTPFYMSPEQARGLKTVDERTDLWSLGVIAFRCVTGRLPFDGESVGDLLVKICTASIPVPSEVQPGLPTSFDAWFARALEREPARRFSSATELSEALAFAAGLAPRSPSNPLGALPTVGPSGGPARPAGPPAQGVTAAPFTASARTRQGAGGWLWGAIAALAAMGAAAGGVMYLRHEPEPAPVPAGLISPSPSPLSPTATPTVTTETPTPPAPSEAETTTALATAPADAGPEPVEPVTPTTVSHVAAHPQPARTWIRKDPPKPPKTDEPKKEEPPKKEVVLPIPKRQTQNRDPGY